MGFISNILSSVLGNTLSSKASSLAPALDAPGKTASASSRALMDRQRRTVKQLVETPFMQGWQFRLECDGQPSDLDIYVKDVTHGGMAIEYDAKQIGSQTFYMPINMAAPKITSTVRDHEDGRIEKWFRAKAAKVLNRDGTVNLPPAYLFKMRLYRMHQNGSETLAHEWLVSAAEYGEVTLNRVVSSDLVSFPMSFQPFNATKVR